MRAADETEIEIELARRRLERGIVQANDRGADGATYDDPGELLAYLKERGMREHELPLPMLSTMYPLKPASSAPHPQGSNGKNGHAEPAKAALPEKAAASSKSSGRQG